MGQDNNDNGGGKQMNRQEIINRINSKVMDLSDDEKQTILDLLSYHECEPMAAAERIADYLNISYECIIEIIN